MAWRLYGRIPGVMLCMAVVLFGSGELATAATTQERPRARELGVSVGVLAPGPLNAITDVKGVKVGHKTLWQGQDVRTGVTLIIPHGRDLYQHKVPAAIHVGNGFGKLAGYTQVAELGNIETPIGLTNTLSVPTVAAALIRYTLKQPGNEQVRSVNAVVGETNDGRLNDIRAMRVTEADVRDALRHATSGPVAEGTSQSPSSEIAERLLASSAQSDLAAADEDMQYAVAIAAFAEILKSSPYAHRDALGQIEEITSAQTVRDADRAEFGELFAKAKRLLQP